jgi:hypothetical protein
MSNVLDKHKSKKGVARHTNTVTSSTRGHQHRVVLCPSRHQCGSGCVDLSTTMRRTKGKRASCCLHRHLLAGVWLQVHEFAGDGKRSKERACVALLQAHAQPSAQAQSA